MKSRRPSKKTIQTSRRNFVAKALPKISGSGVHRGKSEKRKAQRRLDKVMNSPYLLIAIRNDLEAEENE